MAIYYPPPPPFMGGGQPHAPPRLPPAITAVRVDNPPFSDGGPVVIPSSIASIAQPNPWVYTFFGAQQPYDPRQLTAGVPGQSVDLPPFVHEGRSAVIAQLGQVQPNPWQYLFMGGAGPFLPKPVNSGVPGRSADPPPFTLGGPFALKYEGVAVNQPGWSYTSWPYVFMGARQPYQSRSVPPATAAVVANDPPFAHPSRSAAMRAIREAWNPPPFDFQMRLYASSVGPPRLKPTARGYIIY